MTTRRIHIPVVKEHLSGLTRPAKLLEWRCHNLLDLIIHVRNFAAPLQRQLTRPSNIYAVPDEDSTVFRFGGAADNTIIPAMIGKHINKIIAGPGVP